MIVLYSHIRLQDYATNDYITALLCSIFTMFLSYFLAILPYSHITILLLDYFTLVILVPW